MSGAIQLDPNRSFLKAVVLANPLRVSF